MIDFTKFNSITQISEYFSSDQICKTSIIESRWMKGGDLDVVCPYCGHHHCHVGYGGRFVCPHCKNKFSCLVGTIFENTKISLRKWFIAMYLISSHKKGISSCQLAKDIKVTQKTAWYILSKIRTLFVQDDLPLSGEVEMDECYIGGQEKWKHSSKKTAGTTGRSVKTKTPVFGMIQRGCGKWISQVYAFTVPDVKKDTLFPLVRQFVSPDSVIYTDEMKAYTDLKDEYDHYFVRHRLLEFKVGRVSTNNIEGFWAHLRRMITGCYHQVSPEHLQHYVDEEVFRWNRRNFTQGGRLSLILTDALCTVVKYDQVRSTGI